MARNSTRNWQDYSSWSPEQKRQARAYQRQYRNKPIRRGGVADIRYKYNLMARFGITPDEYETLVEAHEGVCAICRQPETAKATGVRRGAKRLSIDHDHKTNLIRGLLCTKCNSIIGLANDNIPRLQAAIAYLERWSRIVQEETES